MMRHDSAQQRAVTFGMKLGGAAAVCTIAALGGTAHAQWSSTFAAPGPNYQVNALALHDDGSGTALYAAGAFDVIDGQTLNRVAKYSGGTWHAVGDGALNTPTMLDEVYSLASFNGELIAAGRCTFAGDPPINYIARWNGVTWQPLVAGFNGQVNALTVYNGELIAGGRFTMAGGVAASNIARWNGLMWQPLGAGVAQGNTGVFSLAVMDGYLFVGGSFASAGGVPASTSIARWDGSNWQGLRGFASAIDATVQALAVHNGDLIVGGVFTSVAGMAANRVARWDGVAWHTMGTGMNSWVQSLVSHNGVLIAGGTFWMADGSPAAGMAKWDGAAWSAVESGVRAPIAATEVRAMLSMPEPSGNSLIIGGNFDANEIPASNIVRRNSAGQWSRLTECPTCLGLSGPPGASIVHDDGSGEALYVAGSFRRAGNIEAMRVARWDGTAWSSVGDGLDSPMPGNASVQGLARFDDGSGGGMQLYAAGGFTTSGATPVSRIARWDGQQWNALPGNIDNGTIYCLTVFDDGSGPALYVGGTFTTIGGQPMNRLARWDGRNWTNVGGGVSGTVTGSPTSVRCLAVYDDGNGPGLAVGGTFSQAGGVAAISLALWRNNAWSTIGGSVGPNGGTIAALAPWPNETGPELICQGQFPVIGGVIVGHIARWDGAAWHNLTPAPTLFPAPALGARMYVTSAANGCKELFALFVGSVYMLARWNGSTWRPLGTGMSVSFIAWGFSVPGGPVVPNMSFQKFDDKLYVAGSYSHVDGLPAANMAMWDIDASFECLADIDDDNNVNINDLLAVINHWGPCVDCPADSSPCGGDGEVNINDLLEVINQWGPCK